MDDDDDERWMDSQHVVVRVGVDGVLCSVCDVWMMTMMMMKTMMIYHASHSL